MVELKPCPFCDGMTHELDDCGYDPEYGEGVFLALEWEDGRARINAVGIYDSGYFGFRARRHRVLPVLREEAG